MPIEKTYNPAAVETPIYHRWEQSGAFACDVKSKAAPFCLMMPPPNVTGSLHMGHALNFTLQDILARYRRMRGRDVLWQPGTDHAGIATQMMVEKQLAAQKQSRREMGREKFLERVWQWKKESGDAITRQLRRLGASCDWSRERFTMDPALNRAVVRAFVTLHREGLIYKDKRLVNWDPKLQTAVSDLEVETREIKGNLWHFKYPIEGAKDEFIIIATTRPETMLGDVAVAVHPKNAKLKHLIGKFAVLPLVGRRIPIIGDDYADPEKGTGAVKITPAHDFNDFEVGRRHKLPMIDIFDQHAKLNAEAPEKYRGLDRFEARKRVVADLEELGLVDKIEPHMHAVPHGDRSGVVIEPWLSEQWYCDAHKLAQGAIKAVEQGKTKFVPQQWENTFFAWMRDIQPWCISRQLWWGHQIPAWYGPDGKIFVAENDNEAKTEAQKHYGKSAELKRDEDVLDTWFSSALWPFSTLGWPEDTPELKRYYPTDVLVTGFDIIFFWVARMMMMGLHFMKDVPFRDVYIHALVRDEKGQKMSKTKGNVIDPLVIIDKYGCDALRFTLANMSTPGRDIKLATGRIEGNRNFATKLWNAARYCQMNECNWDATFDPVTAKNTVNKWIIGETKLAADKIAAHLDEYRFDLASAAAYDFVWNNFCDWYLEFTKPILTGADEAAKSETRAATAWVLAQMLRFLHPFMPYITEELWEQFVLPTRHPREGGDPSPGVAAGENSENTDANVESGRWMPASAGMTMQGEVDGKLLIKGKWPVLAERLVDKNAQSEINWVIKLVSTIRAIRVDLNVPGSALIQPLIKGVSPINSERLVRHQPLIMQLARLSGINIASLTASVPKGSIQVPLAFDTELGGWTVLILPLADVIDLDQERARLGKESEKWAADIKKIEHKLANKDFVDRAPPEVVEEQRERKREAEAMLAKLQAAQKSLAG